MELKASLIILNDLLRTFYSTGVCEVSDRLSELPGGVDDPLTGIDKQLYDIAAKHMIAVQERGDLEARHCDSEDFIEIPVWGLEAALKDAYEAGRKSK